MTLDTFFNYVDIINKLEDKGVDYFYYITPIENINSIFKYGILPKNRVEKEGINASSFALRSAQEKRSRKRIKLHNGEQLVKFNIHDLVPLYLTPKTPTLYKRKDIQEKLCIIEIKNTLLTIEESMFAFTNGNVASKKVDFYYNISDIDEIDFEVINSKYWDDFNNGSFKRCAEFLVYPKVPHNFFNKLVVKDEEAKSRVLDLQTMKEVEVNSDYYF